MAECHTIAIGAALAILAASAAIALPSWSMVNKAAVEERPADPPWYSPVPVPNLTRDGCQTIFPRDEDSCKEADSPTFPHECTTNQWWSKDSYSDDALWITWSEPNGDAWWIKLLEKVGPVGWLENGGCKSGGYNQWHRQWPEAADKHLKDREPSDDIWWSSYGVPDYVALSLKECKEKFSKDDTRCNESVASRHLPVITGTTCTSDRWWSNPSDARDLAVWVTWSNHSGCKYGRAQWTERNPKADEKVKDIQEIRWPRFVVAQALAVAVALIAGAIVHKQEAEQKQEDEHKQEADKVDHQQKRDQEFRRAAERKARAIAWKGMIGIATAYRAVQLVGVASAYFLGAWVCTVGKVAPVILVTRVAPVLLATSRNSCSKSAMARPTYFVTGGESGRLCGMDKLSGLQRSLLFWLAVEPFAFALYVFVNCQACKEHAYGSPPCSWSWSSTGHLISEEVLILVTCISVLSNILVGGCTALLVLADMPRKRYVGYVTVSVVTFGAFGGAFCRCLLLESFFGPTDNLQLAAAAAAGAAVFVVPVLVLSPGLAAALMLERCAASVNKWDTELLRKAIEDNAKERMRVWKKYHRRGDDRARDRGLKEEASSLLLVDMESSKEIGDANSQIPANTLAYIQDGDDKELDRDLKAIGDADSQIPANTLANIQIPPDTLLSTCMPKFVLGLLPAWFRRHHSFSWAPGGLLVTVALILLDVVTDLNQSVQLMLNRHFYFGLILAVISYTGVAVQNSKGLWAAIPNALWTSSWAHVPTKEIIDLMDEEQGFEALPSFALTLYSAPYTNLTPLYAKVSLAVNLALSLRGIVKNIVTLDCDLDGQEDILSTKVVDGEKFTPDNFRDMTKAAQRLAEACEKLENTAKAAKEWQAQALNDGGPNQTLLTAESAKTSHAAPDPPKAP